MNFILAALNIRGGSVSLEVTAWIVGFFCVLVGVMGWKERKQAAAKVKEKEMMLRDLDGESPKELNDANNAERDE